MAHNLHLYLNRDYKKGDKLMYDWIILVLVVMYIFFMVRRGGCCGGHNHSNTHQSTGKRNGINKKSDDLN